MTLRLLLRPNITIASLKSDILSPIGSLRKRHINKLAYKDKKMIHLVYVSSAARNMSENDLLQILEQSRNRNKRQNITGMLLYIKGNFFQVLEGDSKDVEEIYASIVRDERNKGNIVIIKEDINERTFPGWSMGFKHITTKNIISIEGYTEFLDKEMKPEEFTNNSDKVLGLLYQFKKSNV